MSGSDSQVPVTFGRHNDFVGGDASKGRIPGADKATTGHHFVAVDPMGGESKTARGPVMLAINKVLTMGFQASDSSSASRSICPLPPDVVHF